MKEYCLVKIHMCYPHNGVPNGEIDYRIFDKEWAEKIEAMTVTGDKILKNVTNDIRDIVKSETAKSGRHDLLVSGKFAEENEKLIKWFMELAVIMKEDGYTLESLLSIDISAWIEMFQQHGETPLNAYLEDMSNA